MKPKKGDIMIAAPASVPPFVPPILPAFVEPPSYHGPMYGTQNNATLIPHNEQIANVFLF